ncbi:hypothetical protein DY000_02060481 [Brassica cretica]|uniref:Retrotransposon gag domain-containing protein n=1 Tax=Brassica cretica TaxID=69181 RepID=A0ABQ7AW53_BRACR|nr:hypothetical protein DY000_02060481 [Brassica cretica]
MPYLTNQEGLNHEYNVYGFYTQEGVQANWNRAKLFREQEVMNLTSQKFLSLSICEYPTIKGDSNSSKERTEAKTIISFKRDLSDFHKAQDQEKWTRKSEVMINLPEPAKPVLHSPQLEANRFNQLQTRYWRRGDHFNQSGGIPEVLSCTRTQEIRRILEEVIKPNRSHIWKDWTIFRLNLFQANQFRPEDIQTKPRPSEDIMHEPEEFYEFIPCTSPHRIRGILINTKLPYLEILAFKLQQLFFFEFMHDISTFQAIQEIPRKLSYPLKPSRFKITQAPLDRPESHQSLERLSYLPPDHLFGRSIQAPINHLAHPDFQPATFGIRAQTPESSSSWPDDYLSWERTMDDLFSYQGVPKNERLAQAIKQLSEKAYQWWKRVDCSQDIRERYPRRFSNHGFKEAKRDVPKGGHRSLIHQDQIRPNQRPTVLYDQYQPYEVPKAKEKNNFVSQDTLARHKEKSDKPIFQEKAKVSPIFDKFVYKSSPTGMSRLSLSKNVKTGPEVQKDTISKAVHDLNLRNKEIPNQNKEEATSQGKSSNSKNLNDQTSYRFHQRGHFAVFCPRLKKQEFKGEEPPGVTLVMDQKLVQDTMQSMLLKEAKPVVKVSHQGGTNESYMLTEVPRKEPDHKLSHEPPHKWKPKIELSVVQMPRLKVSFSDLKTSKTLDYPCYPVLRSKICQGGGYDAVIRTATELENRPNQFYTRLNWKLTSSISFKPGIGDEEIISTGQKVFQKSLAAPEPRRSGGSLKKSLNQTGAIYG